jgi:hypothetical protein
VTYFYVDDVDVVLQGTPPSPFPLKKFIFEPENLVLLGDLPFAYPDTLFNIGETIYFQKLNNPAYLHSRELSNNSSTELTVLQDYSPRRFKDISGRIKNKSQFVLGSRNAYRYQYFNLNQTGLYGDNLVSGFQSRVWLTTCYFCETVSFTATAADDQGTPYDQLVIYKGTGTNFEYYNLPSSFQKVFKLSDTEYIVECANHLVFTDLLTYSVVNKTGNVATTLSGVEDLVYGKDFIYLLKSNGVYITDKTLSNSTLLYSLLGNNTSLFCYDSFVFCFDVTQPTFDGQSNITSPLSKIVWFDQDVVSTQTLPELYTREFFRPQSIFEKDGYLHFAGNTNQTSSNIYLGYGKIGRVGW